MDRKDAIAPAYSPSANEVPYDEKYDHEKGSDGLGETQVVTLDNDAQVDQHLKNVEEMEHRIQDGTATKDEYMIHNTEEAARKVLSLDDDPTLPAITFRALFLGLGFAAFGASLAQIYYFKPQTINVSQNFLLIITYFFGQAMAKFLPSRGIFRYINPGPFNIKEHVVILVTATTAASSAIAIQVISVQDLYYNNKMNAGIAIFTLLGSQLMGYGFAGILQGITVFPSICLWPSKLATANTFQALHFDGGIGSKRTKFFWTVFGCIFFYEILPQYIFPVLTAVSIVCLIKRDSAVVRNVFGGGSNNEGMGFFSWCFDWNLITSSGLYSPLEFQLNQDAGIFITYIAMACVYYGKTNWNGQNYPFMSQALFDSTGNVYNQSLILDANGDFDKSKYADVGPAYFSATNALFLVVDNLSIGAALVHVFLFNWKDIKPAFAALKLGRVKNRFTSGWRVAVFGSGEEEDNGITDEHYLVQKRNYKQIPAWWFHFILVAALAMSISTAYAGKSGLPWWMILICVFLGFIFTIVYGFLAGILGFTQFVSGGTGLYQMLAGFIIKGKPVANMYAAMLGNNVQVQALALLSDLKLAIYCKVPPRAVFLAQMLGTIVGAIINYVIMLSIIAQQRDALLSVAGTRLWSGQNAQSYNSNAVSWGALAPEMYASGKTYWLVPAALGLGLLLPIPFFIVNKFRPQLKLHRINTAIITQYSCYMSVGINSSVIPSMVIGIASQWWWRRNRPRSFVKYNYLLASALDGGTQVCSFILNFAVFGASGTEHPFPIWAGNPDTSLVSTDYCLIAA